MRMMAGGVDPLQQDETPETAGENTRKAQNAYALGKRLGVRYATAWKICSLLRKAMQPTITDRLGDGVSIYSLDLSDLDDGDGEPETTTTAEFFLFVGYAKRIDQRWSPTPGYSRREGGKTAALQHIQIHRPDSYFIMSILQTTLAHGTLVRTDDGVVKDWAKKPGHSVRPLPQSSDFAVTIHTELREHLQTYYRGARCGDIESYCHEFAFRYNRRGWSPEQIFLDLVDRIARPQVQRMHVDGL